MIKKGDTIKLKPEWMVKGDENLDFYAIEDMSNGRVYASVKQQQGMAVQPTYLIHEEMIEQ